MRNRHYWITMMLNRGNRNDGDDRGASVSARVPVP